MNFNKLMSIFFGIFVLGACSTAQKVERSEDPGLQGKIDYRWRAAVAGGILTGKGGRKTGKFHSNGDLVVTNKGREYKLDFIKVTSHSGGGSGAIYSPRGHASQMVGLDLKAAGGGYDVIMYEGTGTEEGIDWTSSTAVLGMLDFEYDTDEEDNRSSGGKGSGKGGHKGGGTGTGYRELGNILWDTAKGGFTSGMGSRDKGDDWKTQALNVLKGMWDGVTGNSKHKKKENKSTTKNKNRKNGKKRPRGRTTSQAA